MTHDEAMRVAMQLSRDALGEQLQRDLGKISCQECGGKATHLVAEVVDNVAKAPLRFYCDEHK